MHFGSNTCCDRTDVASHPVLVYVIVYFPQMFVLLAVNVVDK